MASRDLFAHSLAEAYLYVMVTPCPNCGKGPLVSSDAKLIDADARYRAATVPATCRACGAAGSWVIQIEKKATPGGGPDEINPSPKPSRILDLAQWITLARMITEAAGRSDDRIQARGFRIHAWQCLDEALKFFEPDNAIPPASAFFTAESRQRFSEHPEHFERSRVLHMRDRLPHQSPTRRS